MDDSLFFGNRINQLYRKQNCKSIFDSSNLKKTVSHNHLTVLCHVHTLNVQLMKRDIN